MESKMINTVALVGTGVIGRGWIQVFVRAGCKTRIYDPVIEHSHRAMSWFGDNLARDVFEKRITESKASDCRERISLHENLDDALSGAQYVQESGPERLEVKHAIFAEMDRLADSSAILCSSTSTLNIEDITAGLNGTHRCFTAHPFNPPHILPAVEMMPTKKADPVLFERAIEFLKSVGQKPVRMNYFVPGYLANRIQAAVVREAIHLVQKGVADVDAVDSVIRDALGLRWAILGNFGTNNTNADGGIREYYSRYGSSYVALMKDLDNTPPRFDTEMIEQIGKGVDAMEETASINDICRWRDRLVLKIRALKEKEPHP
jgi:3-hydroxyacyl-CoA dehydrogenase